MSPTQPSPRKRGRPERPELAARRREEILAAATRLFASEGFMGADLQVVADELGVGKGTLYRYFPSKEALFLAAVDRGMRQLHDVVESSVEAIEAPLDRIAMAVRAYLEFFDARPEIVELIMQERAAFKDRKKPTYFVHAEQNIKPWVELIQQLIDDGAIRNIPAERIAEVISRTLYGVMFTHYFIRSDRSPHAQAEEVLDILFNGILTPEARSRTPKQRKRKPS